MTVFLYSHEQPVAVVVQLGYILIIYSENFPYYKKVTTQYSLSAILH